MSAITQAVRNFKNIWSHGDDDEYDPEDAEAPDVPALTPSYNAGGNGYGSDKYSDSFSTSAGYTPGHGGGGAGSPVRRLRPVATPLRAREKNIYTLRPTNLDEASIAADYLKTGSAVVLNLEAVDRINSMRIIDFMSGVCYGLEGQGHAMKLGETIFLFTPCDFEISSDETDYGENHEFFFKDIPAINPAASGHATAVADAPAPGLQSGGAPSGGAQGGGAQGGGAAPASYHSIQPPDRRSWER